MSYHAYDLDSSDSSDSIPLKPQKKPRIYLQGHSNDQNKKKPPQDSDFSEKYQKPETSKKYNQMNKRSNYDIQDSEDDDDDSIDSKNFVQPDEYRQNSKQEKNTLSKKKIDLDYDSEDSNSQQNFYYHKIPEQSKARAYSLGKAHKDDANILNFDHISEDEDGDLEYTKSIKHKSSDYDTNTRSGAKYSKTIAFGEKSLKSKNHIKNITRTNDLSSNQKTEKFHSKSPNSKYFYQNFDSDSYDDHEYENDPTNNNENSKKSKSNKAKDGTGSSLNGNGDWSFPMKYVPQPDDMNQIIHDYHEKYSIDFLLRRIISNPSYRSSNDE